MELLKSVERKLLISRLLTRSGDQAWAFAVPIVLIKIFVSDSLPARSYFFSVLLAGVLITPSVGRLIDKTARFKLIRIGIVVQIIGVTITLAVVSVLDRIHAGELGRWDLKVLLPLMIMVLTGVTTWAGETILDITVANDIVPTLIPADRIGAFNSKFRQVDLLTEIASPAVAGLILSLVPLSYNTVGLAIIWLWNFISYISEYKLLKDALSLSPSLRSEKIKLVEANKIGIWRKLLAGWPEFRKQKIFLAMAAYSLLWLSVLSPHGVLLTAFLKNAWQLPEFVLGAFRALGAIFGLIATLLFPAILKKSGLIKTSKIFISFQAVAVFFAFICFHLNTWIGQVAFLGFVLLSRIGLYGYSLAEAQMRQMYIQSSHRGRVNGTASALNTLATLALFATSLVFSEPEQFFILVSLSALAVTFVTLIILRWKPDLTDANSLGHHVQPTPQQLARSSMPQNRNQY